jgi:hypothetical protein
VRSHVHAFACAACGGTLTGDDHEPSFTCPWCETDNHVMGEDLPRCFYVEPALESGEAVRVLRRETSASSVDPGFSRSLRVERRDLVFLPFNALRAVRAGRMIVRKEKRRPEGQPALRISMGSGIDRAFERPGSAMSMVGESFGPREMDTKIVFSEMLLSEPACDAATLGADGVELERNVFGKQGRPLVPYSREGVSSRGTVLEPERHPRELRERLEEAGRTDAGEGRRIEIASGQLMQIFYPVWVVRGTYAGRSHRFVVDAVDGTMLAGRVPASSRHRAAVSTAAMLLAAGPITLAGRGASWWASAEGGGGLSSGGLLAWVVVACVLLVAAGWGLMVMGWLTGTLLRSRELVFRRGLLSEEIVSVPATGPVERLGERILAATEKIFSAGMGAARYD